MELTGPSLSGRTKLTLPRLVNKCQKSSLKTRAIVTSETMNKLAHASKPHGTKEFMQTEDVSVYDRARVGNH
jgi:hypothetical protein